MRHCVLAYVNTKRSFDEINLMLQMFEDAEAGRTIQRPQRKVNDEYDVIMNNILMMFLNNTYLNIQLKEKQYRQHQIHGDVPGGKASHRLKSFLTRRKPQALQCRYRAGCGTRSAKSSP